MNDNIENKEKYWIVRVGNLYISKETNRSPKKDLTNDKELKWTIHLTSLEANAKQYKVLEAAQLDSSTLGIGYVFAKVKPVYKI